MGGDLRGCSDGWVAYTYMLCSLSTFALSVVVEWGITRVSTRGARELRLSILYSNILSSLSTQHPLSRKMKNSAGQEFPSYGYCIALYTQHYPSVFLRRYSCWLGSLQQCRALGGVSPGRTAPLSYCRIVLFRTLEHAFQRVGQHL